MKKRNIIKIMLTIAIVLSFALKPFADENTSDSDGVLGTSTENLVKVGLKYGSAAAYSYNVKSASGFYVAEITDEGFVTGLPISAYTEVVIANEGGVITLKGNDGNVILQNFGASALIPLDYDSGGLISVENSVYRGGVTVSLNNSGTINLINVLNVEHYIYGVLNSEMFHTNPIEALKAQAVAARSFAVLNEGRHSSYGFDLCTGTHCQVYKGYANEYAETNRATDETKGLCIYYDGKPVSAYYFKNSGGYTQNIKDVWGGNIGYLKAVKDIYSPEYPWSVTYTFDELKAKLSDSGKNIGDIMSVEIVSRNESRAVDTIKFNGTNGSTTLSKEGIRTFFGSTVVKSTMFSLSGSYNANAGSLSGIGSGNSGATSVTGSSGNICMISDGGYIRSLEADSIVVRGAGGKAEINISNAYIVSGNGTVARASDNTQDNGDSGYDGGITSVSEYVDTSPVTFVGYGYGHGIGMPQDSAIEMAKQGFAFDEILKYYYTDIEIR